MKKLQNETLQKFLDTFIEELKRENEDRAIRHETQLDIPFIISTLYQKFDTEEGKYKDFVDDLKEYPDFFLVVEESLDDYNGLIDLNITLCKHNWKKNEYLDFNADTIPEYNYKICFKYDERDYGWCECEPDMKDYREDKKCCGHGCDASFCSFSLHKVLTVGSGDWDGDEHDYWNFEDEFYTSEKELKDKKEKEDVEKKIKELQEIIETSKQKLYELLGGC